MRSICISLSKGESLYFLGNSLNVNALKATSIAYFKAAKGDALTSTPFASIESLEPIRDYKPNPKNLNIFALTGGKDSALLLAIFKRLYPNERCIAFYAPNINKSESVYEKEAAFLIAAKLKTKFINTKLKNSVRINRENHNIGLREPLALASLFGHLTEKPTHIWFGSNRAFEKVHDKMFASSKSAADITAKLFYPEEPPQILNFAALPENSIPPVHFMFAELEASFPEIAKYVSSCYAQKNFREHKHDSLQKKFPTFKIYQGCGYCVKCMRINAQKYLLEENPPPEFLTHLKEYQEKSPDSEIELLLENISKKQIYIPIHS